MLPYCMRPFANFAGRVPDLQPFNQLVSKIRVRAEHAIAYLKGRFPALRGWRLRCTNDEQVERTTRMQLALLVAHNFAIRFDNSNDYLVYIG